MAATLGSFKGAGIVFAENSSVDTIVKPVSSDATSSESGTSNACSANVSANSSKWETACSFFKRVSIVVLTSANAFTLPDSTANSLMI